MQLRRDTMSEALIRSEEWILPVFAGLYIALSLAVVYLGRAIARQRAPGVPRYSWREVLGSVALHRRLFFGEVEGRTEAARPLVRIGQVVLVAWYVVSIALGGYALLTFAFGIGIL